MGTFPSCSSLCLCMECWEVRIIFKKYCYFLISTSTTIWRRLLCNNLICIYYALIPSIFLMRHCVCCPSVADPNKVRSDLRMCRRWRGPESGLHGRAPAEQDQQLWVLLVLWIQRVPHQHQRIRFISRGPVQRQKLCRGAGAARLQNDPDRLQGQTPPQHHLHVQNIWGDCQCQYWERWVKYVIVCVCGFEGVSMRISEWDTKHCLHPTLSPTFSADQLVPCSAVSVFLQSSCSWIVCLLLFFYHTRS